MRYMFTMMNNARLSVGLEGLARRRAGLPAGGRLRQGARAGPGRRARPAGERRAIIEHPDVRRMLLTMRAYIEALRCLALPQRREHRPRHGAPRRGRAHGARRAGRPAHPDLQGWGTDLGVELTSLAIQVHGGMGYIEETGVAQHYRDIRIAPIYEGTNGIQAIDLVGRKLACAAAASIADYLAGIEATAAEASGRRRRAGRDRRAAGRGRRRRSAPATEWLLAHGADDPDDALAGATPYLRMFGLVTGGWLLARSALAAARLLRRRRRRLPPEFLEQKVVTARFYAEQLLPQAAGLLPAVTAGAADLFAAAF